MNMPVPPQDDARSSDADRAQARDEEKPRDDIQPPPTGGNKGSPAAPVMKQFQKTRAESSGRS